MDRIDVFNGDADGICALHQLRLEEPVQASQLITGVKRDITLLKYVVNTVSASITILDISLDRNRDSLAVLLSQKNDILYIDHHFSGEIPSSDNLETLIDPDPLVCTSLLVDKRLDGKFKKWAITGAFGDNLDEVATQHAQTLGMSPQEIDALKETGVLLNYNGYGADLDDLFYHPAELYQQVQPYQDPLQFHAESVALKTLRTGYAEDMKRALSCSPLLENQSGRIFKLPPAAWARRVSGVYANKLAREKADLAHGLLTENSDGSLRISIRAPLNKRTGADQLCRKFPTGGGRAAAAGINQLPSSMLDEFLAIFTEHFS